MKESTGSTGAIFSKNTFLSNPKGDLRHILKSANNSVLSIAELYFSEVKPKSAKGWKFHHLQTQNISVASGEIRIICINKTDSETVFESFEFDSKLDHAVLTIPPKIYYALINTSEDPTVILNATDRVHDPKENQPLSIDFFDFKSIIERCGIQL